MLVVHAHAAAKLQPVFVLVVHMRPVHVESLREPNIRLIALITYI